MANIRLYRVKTNDLAKAIAQNLITEDDIWSQGEIEAELVLTRERAENYLKHFEIQFIG